jgi:hypothetical protein
MAHRLVTDASGRTWQVRAVHPTARTIARTGAREAALAAGSWDGWQAFERLGPDVGAAGIAQQAAAAAPPVAPGKRRHAPIPPGWEGVSDAAVLAWLAAAGPVLRSANGRAHSIPVVAPLTSPVTDPATAPR